MTLFTLDDRGRGTLGAVELRFTQLYERLIASPKNLLATSKNRRLVKSQPPHALPNATPDARLAPTTRREQ